MKIENKYFAIETESGKEPRAEYLPADILPADTLPMPCGGNLQLIRLWHTLLTQPKSARAMLDEWVAGLDGARQNAAGNRFPQGVLYHSPVRYASEIFGKPPSVVAQLVATGDIVSAMINYFRLTLDFDFMIRGGADVVFEVARLWLGIGITGQGILKLDKFLPADDGTLSTSDENHSADAFILPKEMNLLNERVRENFRWAGKIWFMLGNAGKRELITSRTGVTQAEVDLILLPLSQRPADDYSEQLFALDSSSPVTGMSDKNPLDSEGLASGKVIDESSGADFEHQQESLYLSLVGDCGGLSLEDETLILKPRLPAGWKGYSFQMAYRGSRFSVKVDDTTCLISLTEGAAQMITVYDEDYMLEDELQISIQST